MRESQIERYFRPETLHPAVPAMGRSVQRLSRPAFGAHAHTCMEICLVTGGSVEYFTDNRTYTLLPNAIQVSQPHEIHGTPDKRLHPCTLTWIQFDSTEWDRPGLQADLAALPSHLPQGATELLPYLEVILQECRGPRRDSAFIVEAALFSFLVRLLRIAADSAKQGLPTTLRRAVSLIEERDMLRVNELAEALNTHRSHLHQLFTRYLGQSPQAYIRERIMRRAVAALTQSGDSIVEIAMSLGFNSSQHFASAFKARYGSTPREFRRAALL